MENFTESEIAAENDVVGTEKTAVETEDAENDVAVTEVGTETTVDGTENAIDGGKSDQAGATGGNSAGAAEMMENQEEGHNEEAGDKSSEKKWPGWPGESVFRILVPSHKVGGIIGRKGEFIKKMCEESKARIKIIDASQGAPERVVSFYMSSFVFDQYLLSKPCHLYLSIAILMFNYNKMA